MSEYYKQRRVYMLAKPIKQGETNPGAAATLDLNTLEPPDTGKRRVGRTRKSWLNDTREDMWMQAREGRPGEFDINSLQHRNDLRHYAQSTTFSFNRKHRTTEPTNTYEDEQLFILYSQEN